MRLVTLLLSVLLCAAPVLADDADDEATGSPPQDIQAILERELGCS